ncbi:hypothetical protein T265_11994 [Opisthorchis viverrini]|uniref:Uncharacterized protein n=1 Tax=Opisthorchis viverrini TaxID=6198 RepID=A0A074Z7E7_OPIVI|nr:hypothetical protein T265_11994 [Opisthorchis viverrini]KER19125.1 hypothetical protein T265_11994 [Opisthorchis viverrini]
MHYLNQCSQFVRLDADSRATFVRSAVLCELCLKPKHNAKQCRSRRCCGLNDCRGLHHPLLRPPTQPSAKSTGLTCQKNAAQTSASTVPADRVTGQPWRSAYCLVPCFQTTVIPSSSTAERAQTTMASASTVFSTDSRLFVVHFVSSFSQSECGTIYRLACED